MIAPVVASASTTTTYDTYLASLSPSGWWKLNDPAGSTTATDSSGNGYTGTVYGSPTFGVAGPFPGASAVALSGTGSQYITTPQDQSGPAITVMTWVNSTSFTNNPRLVSTAHTDVSHDGYELGSGTIGQGTVTGQPFFAVGTGTTFAAATSSVVMSPGKWYFVVGTYNGSSVDIYVNGTLEGSTPFSGNISAGSQGLTYIGEADYTQSLGLDYVNGSMSEVAVLPVAISAAQESTLYSDAVGTAPTITSSASSTFVTGQSGSFTVTATGTPTPTFTESGPLPAGVSLSSSGVLSGTPTQSGSFPITVKAANSAGSATQSFTLVVDGHPAFTSASSASFTAGTAGSFSITTSGYPAATISESGALPYGLSFSAGSAGTATISGTPASNASGTFPVVLTATSSQGSVTQDLDVVVSSTASADNAGSGSSSASCPGGPGVSCVETTVSPGTLSLCSVPSASSFPGVTLDGKAQTTSDVLDVEVCDNTGSGAGWSLQATSTPFVNGTHVLSDAGSTGTSTTTILEAPALSCASGSTCTLPTNGATYPYDLPASSSAPAAATLLSASTGTGRGDISVSIPWVLTVPASAYAGTYTSTWTISVVSGP